VTGVHFKPRGPPPVNYMDQYESKKHGCPLSFYIQLYYDDNQQTPADYKRKDEIRNWIEDCFAKFGFEYTCYIVGSTSNGFGTNKSDVDICLVINHDREMVPKSECMKTLKNARKCLRQCGHDRDDLELIPAKVPILRFHSDGVQCDLNVNNLTGLRNTWLLNAYSARSKPIEEARVKPLAMFIKKIAKKCDINNPMSGTLSSYSWNLLFIHFCQKRKILPIIQQLDPTITIDVSLRGLPVLLKTLPKWEVTNSQSLGELLVDFFAFYAEFNWHEEVISVRLGRSVSFHDRSLLKPGHDSLVDKHLRIEEPFDGTNTARAVFDLTNFVRIKYTFIHCAKVLKRAQESGADLYELLESDIVPVDNDIESYVDNEQRNQREFYNRGRNRTNHIIIGSTDEEDGDDDNNDTTTSSAYVPASSDDDEENEKEEKEAAKFEPGPLAASVEEGDADSGRPRAPKMRRVEVTEVEEVSTVDEGIGTKEKSDESNDDDDDVVDLTDDKPEETKTSAIDATKKAILKKMLAAKMAESSSSGSDSDSGSDEASSDDDLILVDELKPTHPKRAFKRRNGNVAHDVDVLFEGSTSQQLPQSKDAMLSSDLMSKFLEADKLDEN